MIGVVGGMKFDEEAVGEFLRGLPKKSIIVTGEGKGLEKWLQQNVEKLGHNVMVPSLRPDLYDSDGTVPEGKRSYPEASTRMMMLARLDQVVAVGKAGQARREGKKLEQAKAMQVTDILCYALESHGTLVIVGSGTRQKAAEDIVKRLTREPKYGKPRDYIELSIPMEVIRL